MAAAAEEDDYSDIAACGRDGDDDADSLQRRFNMAADRLAKMAARLDQQTLLRLYGYYKQATEGPCSTPRPGGWFDARGKAKWDAWSTLGDLASDEARLLYVETMEAIEPGTSREEPSKTAALSWVAVSTLAAREDEVAESEETIWDAARAGRARRVAALLAADPACASRRDRDGMAAAHWAADRGHAAVLDTLVHHAGANIVHQTDSSGQTPLHYAAACGHADAAKVLLAAGATLASDQDGDTPLDLADPTDEPLCQLLRSAPDK